ncbi:LAETG motif-containing sortase-dependent surface protein [Streptomyces sp. NPDC058572]|uniref:LAETG motif-containing sortase-dependent surface protein n=1 Tax=Streptomyces sp. NPDC058572 TaxID=3346546 RepID=UPI0036660610
MPHVLPGRRTSRTVVGALSTVALMALGATPAAVADEAVPDLLLGKIAPIDGVQPGSSFEVPVTVTNKGTKAAEKVWVFYSVTRGLDYAELPSNCEAHQVTSYDEMTAKWNAVCAFDQAVEPGVVYAPEKLLSVKALDRALYDDLRVTVWDYEPGLDDAATTPVRGTAPAVKLVERPGADQGSKDAVDVPVTSVNTADYQVTGAQLKGRVGDTVTMQVTFTNAGPAWVLRSWDVRFRVLITPPAGTSVVKPHGSCDDKDKPGTYSCGVGQRWVNEREGANYTFKLKIDKKVPGAKGSVVLSDEARPFDKNKANDRADITLDVTGGGSSTGGSTGGSGGSTGGSGGSGSTGGSAAGGGSGSSSTGGSGSSSSTGGTGAATTGGDLASTGSDSALPLAGAAAAAVVVGAGAVLVVRRRRAQA